jgi:hypothetical protein
LAARRVDVAPHYDASREKLGPNLERTPSLNTNFEDSLNVDIEVAQNFGVSGEVTTPLVGKFADVG